MKPRSSSDFFMRAALLLAGGIITLYDSEDRAIHYKLLPGTDRLLAIGPVPRPEPVGPNPRLVSWIYYLLVGVLILAWIRPFYRDLDRLRSAALQFGDNDFSARVDVPPDSRILPVARSFNAMAERIEYLVSSHRELTNAVSHELRTPLARFKFSMEILARTTDPAKKEEYLRNMKQDGETEIRIKDDGKGIDPDKLAAIFEPFTRGDTSRDRQSGGYGLGLAIAARIVQRHQGTVTAGNAAPHGALFTIRWKAD